MKNLKTYNQKYMPNKKVIILFYSFVLVVIPIIGSLFYNFHFKPMISLDDNMIFIKGGTFMMGDKENKPIHEVVLSDFYIGKYEVTQKEWGEIMGNSPSEFKGADRPVTNVSWDEIQVFLKRLNEKTGEEYCLPTEAQWEYAAKGGDYFVYSGSEDIEEVAWYDKNSGGTTHPVGKKKANGYGLYDMSGNVFEWCQDQSESGFGSRYNYYQECKRKGVVINPISICQERDSVRVMRGGSWTYYMSNRSCSVTYRDYRITKVSDNQIGFRLCKKT
jgi:formylglycine-generating enzyme required for sulfatase activity